MNLLIIFTFAVLIVASTFSPGQEQVTKTEQIVREMEGKLTAALSEGDSASVDAILSDDYTEINAQGLIRRKSDLMAFVRARASAPRSKSLGPEIAVKTKLHMYGDTAILIGLTTTRYQHMEYQTLPQAAQTPSQNATYQERFMKVFARVNGRWQLAASQSTAIAKS